VRGLWNALTCAFVFAFALSVWVLAQTPATRGPLAVALTSRRPNTDALAPKIATRVVEILKREAGAEVLDDPKTLKALKAAGFSDPRSCNGGQTCSARLAVLLGPRAVLIGVDVGKVGKSVAIHVEAFAADLPEPLAVADVTVREEKWSDQSLAELTTFAREVSTRLPIAPASPAVAATPKKPADQPVAARLEPQDPSSERADLTTTAPATASKVPAIVVASGAGAALVVAGIFTGLAAVDRGTWNQNVVTQPNGAIESSTLTQPELQALGSGLNTRATVALTSGLLAVALGGVATWLFLKPEPAPALTSNP
jgi:hypothetical protein